jgi:hypothetical protein
MRRSSCLSGPQDGDRGQVDLDWILTFVVMAIIGVVIIGILIDVGAVVSSGEQSIEYPDGSFTVLDSRVDDIPGSVSVRATTERALAFDGESYVESSEPKNLSDSWTVCATGELDSDANEDATYTLVAYDNETILLEYDAGQWSAYYDNGTHDGKATVDIEESGGLFGDDGLTPVCGRFNESTGNVSVHSLDGDASAPLTASTTSRNVSWGWEGTIDEARTFNDSLSDETIDEYIDDPVQPLPGTNRTARFMFDEGEGSSTRVYFANVDATVVGATWTGGVPNPSKWLGLASAIEEGDDYELAEEPFSIRVVESGYLDGAPVIHVSWGGAGDFPFNLMGLLTLFMGLIILVTIANRVMDMT